jgi:redox-sensing transcriptional repressor
MKGDSSHLPRSVIGRLTKYLALVQDLCGEGVEWVSSHEIADSLGLTSSTVRQDLSHLDFSGISKRGYKAAGLREALVQELGADTTWSVVVVGAGNLGRALALHEEFARRGFNIRGIFDSDSRKIGRRVGALTVRSMRDLPNAVRRTKAEIGILAVPPSAAQGVADLLIASGIKGVLNLALTHITAPKRVTVIDARIVASLLELSHAIRTAQAE